MQNQKKGRQPQKLELPATGVPKKYISPLTKPVADQESTPLFSGSADVLAASILIGFLLFCLLAFARAFFRFCVLVFSLRALPFSAVLFAPQHCAIAAPKISAFSRLLYLNSNWAT